MTASTQSLRTYRLHDLNFGVLSEDEVLVPLVDQTFEYHGVRPAHENTESTAFTLRFNRSNGPATVPDETQTVAKDEEFNLEIFTRDREVYLTDGMSIVRLREDERTAYVTLYVGDVAQLSFNVFKFGTVALLGMLPVCKNYAMHAAALEVNTRGVLLAGTSGSGKSTLSLGLVRAGARYLSDDSIVISEDAGQVRARPLRTDFAVFQRDLIGTPEGKHASEDSRSGAGKVRLDLAAYYPEQKSGSTIPSVILFPVIENTPASELIPIGTTEAFVRLLEHSSILTQDPRVAAAQLNLIKKLSGQCRSFELRSGTELHHEPERVLEYIGKVLSKGSETTGQ